MAKRKRYNLPELAAEVVRRGDDSYVVHVSVPPTASERLQLLSAHLRGQPIIIAPPSCKTVEEWILRYAPAP